MPSPRDAASPSTMFVPASWVSDRLASGAVDGIRLQWTWADVLALPGTPEGAGSLDSLAGERGEGQRS